MPNERSNPLPDLDPQDLHRNRIILEHFEQLIVELWQQLQSVMGTASTALIFQCALRDTIQEFPLFEYIRINNEGLDLSPLDEEDVMITPTAQLQQGCLTFLKFFFEFVANLTGMILVGKLEPLVSGFRSEIINSN